MPLTIAHPAAAILLRWACPRYLSWSALIIGTTCPDFDYFLTLSNRSGAGHTAAGSFYFCLPIGLVLYALFHIVVKRPAALLLPVGEHRRVWDQAASRVALFPRSLPIAGGSVFIGAWTHLAWDSLSHARGWAPRTFPVLRGTLFDIHGYEFTLFRAIQHGSTVFGALCLLLLYLRWRRTTPVTAKQIPRLKVTWHFTFLTVMVLAPLLGAAALANNRVSPLSSFLDFREWLGAFAVGTLSLGALVLVVVCAIVGWQEKQLTRAAS